MLTLSAKMMYGIFGVGAYNIAGASDWRIIGPRLPVVVIDIGSKP
jgi:hypothetical protein